MVVNSWLVVTETSYSPVLRMKTLTLLLAILLTGCLASPSPAERLKVKYKIRTGSGGVEKQKVNHPVSMGVYVFYQEILIMPRSLGGESFFCLGPGPK